MTVVVVAFHAFGNEEVFPECTHVVAKSNWGELLYDGIAYSIVVEVYLLGSFQLSTEVAAQTTKTEDDVAFFQ
jgi:hypothetical protein